MYLYSIPSRYTPCWTFLLLTITVCFWHLPTTSADFEVIGNHTHQYNAAANAGVGFVNKEIVVLFITKADSTFQLRMNSYEWQNNSLTKKISGAGESGDSTTAPSLDFKLESIVNGSVMTIKMCSSTTCNNYVYFQNQLWSTGGGKRCPGVQGTREKLLAISTITDYNLLAFSDNSGARFQIARCGAISNTTISSPICKVGSMSLTDVLSTTFDYDSSTKTLLTLAVMKKDSTTALCWFRMNLLNSPANVDSAAQLQLVNRPGSLPVGLAVSKSINDYVAFLSYTDGYIMKFFIGENGMFHISDYNVPTSGEVIGDLALADDQLVAVDTKQITVIDVKEVCSEHKDICSCRQPKDPKCGWCLLSQSCTEQQHCNGNGSVWIVADAQGDEICIQTNHSPLSSARNSPQPLVISTEGKAVFSNQIDRYKCIYGTSTISSDATYYNQTTIRCAPPAAAAVNNLYSPGKTASLPVTIYDVATKSYLPLAVPYRLVICSDISSCDECTKSHGSCVWCKNEFKCTNDPSNECPESTDQASKSGYGQTESCPAVASGNIQVPANVEYQLNLNIQNFPTKNNLIYNCLVDRKGVTTKLSATRSGDQIKCSPHNYGVSDNPESFLLDGFTVDISTENDIRVASTPVTLYDCAVHTVCTHCMQFNAIVTNQSSDCVWCSQASQCLFNSCPSLETAVRDKCPQLIIIETKPDHVPVEGGLVMTIRGRGLVISSQTTIAITLSDDKECTIINRNGKDPRNSTIDIITCMLPPMSEPINSILRITINGVTWEKPQGLIYYNPQMVSLRAVGDNPNKAYGPVAGGTHIKIVGPDLKYLANTDMSIFFTNPNKTFSLNCKIISEYIECITPPVSTPGEKYSLRLKFTEKNYTRQLADTFTYKPNSTIISIAPSQIIAWGDKVFQVEGQMLDSVGNPRAQFSNQTIVPCNVVSSIHMKCQFPEFNTTGRIPVVFLMDGIDPAGTTLQVDVLPNPRFDNFTDYKKSKAEEVILSGENFNSVGESQLKILVGEELCNISKSIEDKLIVCIPPATEPEDTLVTVYVDDKLRYTIGHLVYDKAATAGLSDAAIGGIAGGISALVIILILVSFILFRRSRYHKQRYKSMVKHVDQLESSSRNEIKQAFAELQTDMSDLLGDLNATGIPYWDYKNFTFKILFPGQTDHPSLHKLMTKRKNSVMQALDKFEHLIYNKHFLVTFVHTLEAQPTFTMQDKVQLASLLMLTLQHKMDYATHVIKELLSDLIDVTIKKHPKLLLRRSESVVEKMLTYWLSLCLYRYLQDHAGTPLFMLYKAIKLQIEKGPVDVLTGEARYSLSQDRLLRQTVDTKPMTILVRFDSGEEIPVKVNDCDTPSQVKEKILDTMYKNQAYSTRPIASDYNLEWHPGMVGVPISDEDLTSQTVNGWKRLNTLAHYSISNMAVMKLVPRYQAQSLHSDRSRDTDKLFDTLSTKGTPRGTLTRTGTSAVSTSNLQDHFTHNHISLWHLTKSPAQTLPKDRQQTMMSEIFLTRLLKTKGTLQEFIDKLLITIFSAENLPPTIKYLFDFLDQEAARHGISDPEVVHVWKNNSLHLRFWVNIIKNPEFVFDIHKTEIVDASLMVIAQTFIDSCAMTESDFGADAPINKLLFARDRPRYRKMLQTMYNDIRNQPPVPEQTLNAHLSELSKMYPREFYRNSALKDIYQFAQRYQKQIIEELDNGYPRHRNPNLTTLFRSINTTLEDDHTPIDV